MPSVLDDKLKQHQQTIAAKKEEAKQKWGEFASLRDKLAASDVDITDESSDAFKKAHEAHQAYGVLADEIQALEDKTPALVAMTGERGRDDAGTPGAAARERFKDAARSVHSASLQLVAGQQWKAAAEAGVFERNVQFGQVQFGEWLDRRELHALVTGASATSAGAMVWEDQDRGFFQTPDRPLFITDLITVSDTDSDAVQYVRETAFTNNAAPVAEATDINTGGAAPQSNVTYERVTEDVIEIKHFIPTTRRALADAGQLRGLLDGRLRMGLAQELEDQIIAGDGTGENFLGILNTPGIQSQTLGTDSVVDAIHKALTKVRLAFFLPTAAGMNPLDWQEIRLEKDLNGQYLYGPPAMAGTPTVWGVPVASGPQFPENNPVVGDFRRAELWMREGVQVYASDSHADFFTRGLVALLGSTRAAFGIPQPAAFCEVTA